jgi:hypothetical protein
MTALEFLCRIKYIPCMNPFEHPRDKNKVPLPVCSKGERSRMLKNGAVVINGRRPGPKDEINFPIDELIFFPNGERRCTMIYETAVDQTENLLCEEGI